MPISAIFFPPKSPTDLPFLSFIVYGNTPENCFITSDYKMVEFKRFFTNTLIIRVKYLIKQVP